MVGSGSAAKKRQDVTAVHPNPEHVHIFSDARDRSAERLCFRGLPRHWHPSYTRAVRAPAHGAHGTSVRAYYIRDNAMTVPC